MTEVTPAQWVDRTRNVLSFFLIGAFVGALVALTVRAIPTGNKDLLTYMLGQLSGMALMALGYYFSKGAGQDALDAAKTDNTGKMAEAVIAAASAGSSGTPVAVGAAADQVADAAVDAAADVKGTGTVPNDFGVPKT